jgi:Zn-dependent protease with chaperone function
MRPDPAVSSPTGRSIFWRAVLAIGLMIGFYGLAVGLAAFLFWIPYAEVQYANRIHLKLALVCIVSGFLILKAVFPRGDRFEAPGPVLDPARQPRLFRELNGIARSTSQEMPAEVYLIPDVNAWVSQRGGIMGFGSRRVMGLGLPLLSMLRVPELRAVLAHEFGHYYGGDVKLGPWIYKTRQALIRTVLSLGDSAITKPFEWYGNLFFRLTHRVSRQQELQADALAASVAGAPALAGGLRAVHRAGIAFQPYWAGEVSPVLTAGFLPPLAGGFDQFLKHPEVAERVEKAMQEEEKEGEHNPYDTHPSLRERLAAIGNPAPATVADGEPFAIALLEDVKALEQQLLIATAGAEAVRALKPVAWDEVGATVYAPMWSAFLEKHGPALSGLTPSDLPSLDWKFLGAKVADSLGAEDRSDVARYAGDAVGVALAVALMRRGFVVEAPPGGAIQLKKDGDSVEPFLMRRKLTHGEIGAEAWRAFCERVGIGGVDLARSE